MKCDPRVELFRAVPAELGEGVMWHPARQTLFWIDILGRKIFETRPGDAPTRTIAVDQLIGAIVPTADGGLLAAVQRGIFSVDEASGTLTPFALPPQHDATLLRFNDAKCDPAGRLWAGTMALDQSAQSGRLYRIDCDATVRVMREAVTVSNGLAWSPDARTLYYIDSPTRVVQAFDYDADSGEIARARIAIDLTNHPGVPDGCTIDAEGHLWIAHWGGAQVTRWDPIGARLIDTLMLPVSHVTSCTFGGTALDQLFISTAAADLTPAQRATEPEAGFLFSAQTTARGLPAHTFGNA